ncbi:M56 family metallopeptidase [Millisia brevis]|uniref:M56 family metallopeptidase n=1 Tax=Millisia brevis TaxID=264148 RepID=UPI000A7CEB6A|nr:M56 family metallopeptidase [Millisia brevis]
MPAVLANARWTFRAPAAALVLWQSIALAAVLSAFSCGLAIASVLMTTRDGRRIPSTPADIPAPLWYAAVTVFAVTLLIGARLIFSTCRVVVRTRRRRAHHRDLVDLLDGKCTYRTDDLPHDLRVIETGEPMAYCLPGLRRRVVVSEGTLHALTAEEVDAILRHERSHLRARHDLLIEAFTAVYEAFPRVVRSGSALGAVALLVEMVADDSAVRVTGPLPLARALVHCSGSHAPKGALAAGATGTLARVRRLGETQRSRTVAITTLIAAAAILVLPTVYVAIPWLHELQRLH